MNDKGEKITPENLKLYTTVAVSDTVRQRILILPELNQI